MVSPIRADLYSVWGSDHNNVYAVGSMVIAEDPITLETFSSYYLPIMTGRSGR